MERKAVESSAQKGVSEAYLEKYLRHYFPTCQIVEDCLPIPNFKYHYSTDFSIVAPEGVAIDLEIDEPYEGKSKKPHHCWDNDRDYKRNRFFVERGWIVLRISEYQVVHQPKSICALIGKVLAKTTGNQDYRSGFKGIERLKEDSLWSENDAKKMAKRKYRENYLEKAGIYRARRNRSR